MFEKYIILEPYTAYDILLSTNSTEIKIYDSEFIFSQKIAGEKYFCFITREHKKIKLTSSDKIAKITVTKNNNLNKLFHLYLFANYYCYNPKDLTTDQDTKITKILESVHGNNNAINISTESLYGERKTKYVTICAKKNIHEILFKDPNNLTDDKFCFYAFFGYIKNNVIQQNSEISFKLSNDNHTTIVPFGNTQNNKLVMNSFIGIPQANIKYGLQMRSHVDTKVTMCKFIKYGITDNIKIKFRHPTRIKYDVAIIIAFLGRYSILNKIINATNNNQHNRILIILVGSTSDDHKFIKYISKTHDNIYYIMAPNNPLGLKWQIGVSYARTFDINAIMILGSDDIVCKNYIKKCYEYIKLGYDFIGKRIWHVYNVQDNSIYKLSYLGDIKMSLGAGRMYSRKVLDKHDWIIFDIMRNHGLDEYGHYLVEGKKNTIIDNRDDVYLLSIKGAWTQMNPLNKIREVAKSNKKIKICKCDYDDVWLKSNFGTLY